MSFTTSKSLSFAEITPRTLHGNKILGGYLLIVPIEFNIFNVKNGESPSLQGFTVDLYFKKQNSNFLIGNMYSMHGTVIHQAYEHVNKVHQDFAVKINQKEIDQLELLRNGGDFSLELKMKGLIYENGNTRSGWDEKTLSVERSAWLKILEQIGYSKIITIEIPTTGEGSNPELEISYLKLQEAQNAFFRNDWKQAVSLCRDCLETLPAKDTDFTKSNRDYTKFDRMQVLQRIMNLCHLAKHSDELSHNTSWYREDALFMLATCGAFIHKFSRGHD
jgi:hypothetical protein